CLGIFGSAAFFVNGTWLVPRNTRLYVPGNKGEFGWICTGTVAVSALIATGWLLLMSRFWFGSAMTTCSGALASGLTRVSLRVMVALSPALGSRTRVALSMDAVRLNGAGPRTAIQTARSMRHWVGTPWPG